MLLKYARRVAVAIVGTTVLLIGVAMIILPGPAIIVIPIGLAILASEYAWARRWLRFVRESAEKGAEKLNLRSIFSKKANSDEQDAA
jgi:tellurite resistance protein TerC